MKETLFEGYVIATLLRTEQLKLKLLMVSVQIIKYRKFCVDENDLDAILTRGDR